MRVLIVDGSALIVKRLQEMLLVTENSTEVFCSDSYSAGFQIFETCNPDVVLLGVGLPKEKPIALLNSIKTLNKKMPVILLSLNMDDNLHEQCAMMGADFFLDKYYDFQEIPGLLQRIAGKED